MDAPSDRPPAPRLTGERLTVRPGTPDDVAALLRIRAEPSVMRWWRAPGPPEVTAAELAGADDARLLVIEVDGAVAGGIQYSEEADPEYRHATIDVYLSERHQGRGLGGEAITLLARFLIDVRGHHRITIDPSAANARAIRCYAAVGFRAVGVLRQYEREADGVFRDGLLMDLLAEDLAPDRERE